VGLDGVPHELLVRLAGAGVMPRVAEIIRGGGLRKMRAALPPVSSVSWSSFMTGANPGEHGIFGFTDLRPDSYELRFPLFSDLAAPPLWDRLAEAGRRSAIINQPATYPARPISGVLISGFVAPSLERSVWPPALLPALARMGYRIDVDTQRAGKEPGRLLDELEALLAARRRAAAHFWDQEPWDYFEVVVTGTDRLHHFLWPSVEDDGHPRYARAMAYYAQVDALVGEMWDRFHAGRPGGEEGQGFVMLSDHGFTAAAWELRLNAWLRERGYLTYQRDAPDSVADLAPGTRAFALDPGRIYLNVRGRFPGGCVEPEEAAGLAEEIAAGLGELTHQGEPVISHVLRREEIYRGPLADRSPDLVALGRPGYDLKGTTRSAEAIAPARLAGMHTWEDAFVWTRLPVPEGPEIADLAPAIVPWLLG